MERVGIVGAGAMGIALLERLRSASVPVTVFDVSQQALDAAQALGAVVASSPQGVAEASTLVDVVVRTDQEVVDCVLGGNGLLKGAAPGTLLLLHSTISPRTTRKIFEAASPRGVEVVDACMVGRPHVVRAGEMSFLAGGPAGLVERARPHLLRLGPRIMHMGPLGSGNVAKIIKNLMTGCEALILHEAAQIGAAAGIPPREALNMMRELLSGPGTLSHWEQTFVESEAALTPRVGANIYDKDLPLAAETARDLGVHAPITEQIAAAGLRLVQARSS